MSHLFYGVAYYDEYMPEDRLAKDIALMRETGINVVRIAESTWSTLEPEEGQYNFYHIDRVLEAMHEAGIAVIVGTPTYAVPAWLAAKHPDILVTTVAGQQKYGPRQIMDIVNPTFRRYAEKIIRTLMALRRLSAGNWITKPSITTILAAICRRASCAACRRNILTSGS